MATQDYTPSVTGVNKTQTFSGGSTIDPFSTVSISDANPDATIQVDISQYADVPLGVSDTNGSLTGTDLVDNHDGTYTLTAPLSAINSELDSAVFTPVAANPIPTTPVYTGFLFNVTDTTDNVAARGPGVPKFAVDIGQTPPPPPASQFLVVNTTAGPAGFTNGTPYTGPVAGIKTEFNDAHGSHPIVDPTKLDPSLNVTAYTPDVFIVTGNGTDAIDVGSHGGGNNILDGGEGSNFLTGGAGHDTFFVDARAPTTTVWSTVNDFHAGDAATIWGVTPSDFALTWLDNQGAKGYTGLTGSFVAAGKPEVQITLAGFTTADLTDGKLAISYGRTGDLPGLPGSDYMHVAAT